MSLGRWSRGAALLAACASVVLACASVSAQARPSVAVLRTSTAGAVPEGLAGTVDRAVRARVPALADVEVRGSVALDLADVQLALGCEGETQSCLRAVADELGVRYLLIPNVDLAGSQIALNVALFDASSGSDPARAVRRAPGEDPSGLLEELDALLSELFRGAGVPAAAISSVAPGPDGASVAGASVLSALGAVALGVGIGLGVASSEQAAAYEAFATPTPMEADRALALFRSASDLALGANVLFGAGGAVLAAGLVWLVAALASGSSEAPPVQAFVSETAVGLAFSGALPEVGR